MRDKQLGAKLRAELPGILNWALEGLKLWQEEGLGYPDEIREATEGYRAEMDILKDFLDDCTFDNPDGHSVKPYRAYTDWCELNDQKPIGSKTFSQLLAERGYKRGKFGSDSQRGFKGLELLPGWPKNAI